MVDLYFFYWLAHNYEGSDEGFLAFIFFFEVRVLRIFLCYLYDTKKILGIKHDGHKFMVQCGRY